MPVYPWLLEDKLDVESTPAKISTMRKLGVPYPEGYEGQAIDDLNEQANNIADGLLDNGIIVEPDAEIVALIAICKD